jgi:hypothetical protein
VYPSQYLGVPCLLALTDIHPPFAALGPNGYLDSLAVLTGRFSSVPCLVPVMPTLEGNSTANLHALGIGSAFFTHSATTAKPWVKAQSLRRCRATSRSSKALPEAGVIRWAVGRASVIWEASKGVTLEATGLEASSSIVLNLLNLQMSISTLYIYSKPPAPAPQLYSSTSFPRRPAPSHRGHYTAGWHNGKSDDDTYLTMTDPTTTHGSKKLSTTKLQRPVGDTARP